MEVSPLRALTHKGDSENLKVSHCRNGSKPVEGIDTALALARFSV